MTDRTRLAALHRLAGLAQDAGTAALARASERCDALSREAQQITARRRAALTADEPGYKGLALGAALRRAANSQAVAAAQIAEAATEREIARERATRLAARASVIEALCKRADRAEVKRRRRKEQLWLRS